MKPTVREINKHVAFGKGSCYIFPAEASFQSFRITAARNHGPHTEGKEISSGRWWRIEPSARIELK